MFSVVSLQKISNFEVNKLNGLNICKISFKVF